MQHDRRQIRRPDDRDRGGIRKDERRIVIRAGGQDVVAIGAGRIDDREGRGGGVDREETVRGDRRRLGGLIDRAICASILNTTTRRAGGEDQAGLISGGAGAVPLAQGAGLTDVGQVIDDDRTGRRQGDRPGEGVESG